MYLLVLLAFTLTVGEPDRYLPVAAFKSVEACQIAATKANSQTLNSPPRPPGMVYACFGLEYPT